MQIGKNEEKSDLQSLEDLVNTRGTLRAGYFVAALFVLLIVVWGGSVPITSNAIASGVVGVEGHKKQVQHLNGGIVKEIKARDGDVVEKGQVLVVLDDVDARSKFNELNNKYIQASVEFARWTAEQNLKGWISTPKWLLANSDQPAVKTAMARQSDILASRLAAFEQTKSNLRLKLSESEKVADTVSASLVDLEAGDSKSEINMSKQKAAQLDALVTELQNARIQESAEQAAKTQELLQSLRQQVVSVKNLVNRSTVKAPISGLIINSAVNTVGGIVRAGDTVMEILPTDERLLISGQVPAKNRNSVHVGQRAEVTFSAFGRRPTLPLEGKVKLISADSVVDPDTSLPYYKATIEIDGDPTDVLNGETLFPGMQADILVVTGTQTFVQYFLSPITTRFTKAFRES